jgi:hypothetical protein
MAVLAEIRPLEDSKQATNKKAPPDLGLRGGASLSGLSGVLGGGAEREATTRFAGTIVGFEI